MKTQIIYLDPHDDHNSVRDKISWAQAPRILLVWPPRGQILNRRLDLVLLERHAKDRGSQLGLVSLDPIVRENADALSIPVFESVDHVPEYTWIRGQGTKRARPKRRGSPILEKEFRARKGGDQRSIVSRRWMGWVLFLLSILVVLLMAFVIAPSADILISPEISPFELSIDLPVALDSSTLPQDALPAQLLTIEISGNLRLPTTGRTSIPEEFARGDILLTNLTTNPVTIPSGTGVRDPDHEHLRFEVLGTIVLPGQEGAQAEGSIRAMSPGPTSNLPSGAIRAIEGPLGLIVDVTNPEPLKGGTTRNRPAVSILDHRSLREELSAHLLGNALDELEAKIESGWQLIEESINVAEELEETYDHPVGEASDTVGLDLRLRVEALAYNKDDLAHLASTELESRLPPGVDAVPNTLEISTPVFQPDQESQEILIHLNVLQLTYQPIDPNRSRDLIKGKSVEEAIDLLESRYNFEEPPEIQLTPSWPPLLPLLDIRIEFQYRFGGS